MSSQGDKKLTISVGVETQSLNQTKTAIRDLTREIKSLVDAMKQARNTGSGGLLSGGSGTSGRFNVSTAATIQAPTMRGGGGNALTSGVAQEARSLKELASSAVSSIRTLTSSFREGAMGQVQTIERLKSQLRDLNAEYDKLRAKGLDTKSVQSAMYRTDQDIAANMHARFLNEPSGVIPRGGQIVNRGGIDYVQTAGGSGPPPGGLSRFLPFGGALLAGAGTGVAAYNSAMNAAQNHADAAAQYHMTSIMFGGQNGARIGGSLGAAGMAIRGGSLSTSMAFTKLQQSGAFANLALGHTADREYLAKRQAGYSNNGVTELGARLGETYDKYAARGFNALAGGWNKVTGAHVPMMPTDSLTARQQAWSVSRGQMSADVAQQAAEMMHNLIASNPRLAAMTDATYGNAMGNIGMARMGGISLGNNRFGTGTAIGDFNYEALRRGFSGGERAAANAQLGSVAGRGLMGNGLQMLELQGGGFHNASSIYALGAQFGGGGSRGAQGLLNAAMDRGGLDVTAMSQLAGTGAGLMGSGNFFGAGSGRELMQGLMSAGYTGTPGGDMRQAGVIAAGMGAYGRDLSGQTDRLQEGINTLAANASGAHGWYAKKAIMGLGPGEMIQALRSGKVPWQVSQYGVTGKQLADYNQFQNKFAFSRYVNEGTGSAVDQAVAGVRAAGGTGAYLKQLLGARGLSAGSSTGRALIDKTLGSLALARRSTKGGTFDESRGALEAEIMGDTSLRPALAHRGVGLKLQGPAKAVAEDLARQAKEQGEFEAQHPELAGAIKAMVGNENKLAGLTKGLVEDAGNFDKALQTLTRAILNSLDRIDPRGAAQLRKETQAQLEAAKQKAAAK